MKRKEKIILGIVVFLMFFLGFCMFLGYFAALLSIPFSMLGLCGGGILMRDDKYLKWGWLYLFLTLLVGVGLIVVLGVES